MLHPDIFLAFQYMYQDFKESIGEHTMKQIGRQKYGSI